MTTHSARWWLDRAIRQTETRRLSLVKYARAWYHITTARILLGDIKLPQTPLDL